LRLSSAKPCVLLVEDEPITLSALERLLSSSYRVLTAREADEALRILKRERVEVVVADLRLPKGSGLELLEWVRHNLPETRVIIITGYSSIKGAVEAMRLGASDYIPKPFSVEDIQRAIAGVLQRREEMLGEMREEEFEAVLRALLHPMRRKILSILSRGSLTFTAIWKSTGAKDPTSVNFHLKKLKKMGMLVQDSSKLYRITPLGREAVSLMKSIQKARGS